jgi:proteasome lid subunit RPN8/RPN11
MIHYDARILVRLSRLLPDIQTEQVAVFTGRAAGHDYMIDNILLAVNECTDRSKFFISNRQIGRIMQRAGRSGQILLGVVHTHPAEQASNPSQADLTNCLHAVNAVYHPASGRLTFFNSSGIIHAEMIQTAPVGIFSPGFSSA